ncbi:MAG TPA: glycoside hydrolase family 2 TIM barrel-domain containing protein [Pseudomonadales bacterium]|nr:glycoside hydrolase family 2 TIM barrel-domain containing protein [Pseudomonadales bacterium]
MDAYDIFARIAVDRRDARSKKLVAPRPIPAPKRKLPLDKIVGASAFEPLPRLETAADLRLKLDDVREAMAGFLSDLAPTLKSSRLILPLEEFDWREETADDRQNFSSTLAGKGSWMRVSIPHYGPPLGRAVTYYRVTFKVTAEMIQKGALFVAFDGVDYKAHVFVNDAYLGSHEGFFAPFEFDFTSYARLGDNTLVVKVENDYVFMGSVGGVNSETLDGDKMYAATGLGYDDPKLGWHHCPAGMGICQGVRIEARSRLFIRDLYIRPLPDDHRAEAWVEVFNCDLRNIPVSFDISLFGQNFPATVFRDHLANSTTTQIAGHGDLDKQLDQVVQKLAGPGVSQFRITFEVPNARKWDLDTPWLYQLQVKLRKEPGEICDTGKQQFGMRTFVQDDQSTPKGKFYLNDREIRLRGANTMGFEQGCVFREDWQQLIDDILLAKICNLNYLRLTQRPVQREVYEYCDRLGLMTQTDLPLFGCLRRNKLCEAIRQVEEMERLVRPHACNVLVSYINEPFPNGQGRPHRNLTRDELEVFFDVATKVVRMCNPERVVKYVDGDYDPPTSAGMPDNHCYCGWYIGHAIDLGSLNRGNWMAVAKGWHYGCGEFGAEGLDNLEVMRKFYPAGWLPAAGEKQTEPWRPSKLAQNQTDRFQYLWFPSQTTPEGWIAASQRHQAWITRMITEAFRRDSRMNSFAIHLFIDAWPCGWMKSIMDVLRAPKKAFFAYREALTPLMVSLRTDRHAFFSNEKIEMEAWICNDTHSAPAGAQLHYQLEIEGRVVQSGRAAAKIPTCSSRPQGLVCFTLPELNQRSGATVRLALADKSGKVLFDTSQEIEIFPKLPQPISQRAFIIGSRNGLAATLANQLGLAPVFKGSIMATDVILVDDPALFAAQESAVESAVRAGATAVLLELPVGRHSLLGHELKVVAGGMGPRHFAESNSDHDLVAGFKPYDFWFWHDHKAGHPTPLLDTVFESVPTGWQTIIKSGNGSWTNEWKPVAAVMEQGLGQGIIRLCQVKLAHRIKTNPAAALFAHRLLNLDRQAVQDQVNKKNESPNGKSLNGSRKPLLNRYNSTHETAKKTVFSV